MNASTLDAVAYVHSSVLPLSLPQLILITIVFCALTYWLTLTSHDESPATFSVVLPEEMSQQLLEPSLRTPNSTLIQCYAPATGRLLGRVNPATSEGIDRAITRAAASQTKWATTTFRERRRVLQTLLKHILDHQDEIVRIACLDSGKPRVDAALGEVLVTVEKLRWTLKHGERALWAEKRPANLLLCYKHNEVRWEPMGVVAALVSWNYPFHNLLNPIISSLFAGNAIVLKSSEATCWSAQYYVSIAKGALQACGHSTSSIQLITCWPETAPHLTSHPGISHITFIGSQEIAHKVSDSASKSLTPLCLELGGKDPAIILDDLSDSRIKQVASVLMRGVFQSAGQNCIGIERVVALPRVYQKLIEILLPRVKALRVGSALDEEEEVDIGACISDRSFTELEKLIEEALSQGARLLHGGKRHHHPKCPHGHYFTPTLIVDVTPQMAIAQTELFAPVLCLMKASSVEDAVAIANSTQYALGSSVFGKNQADLDYATKHVKAGMVAVNDFASYYLCGLPFGGVGRSGYGRFLGEEGLRSLCNQKSVQIVAPWAKLLGIQTSIPPRLDYHMRHQDPVAKAKAWQFVKGIIEVGYGMSLLDQLRGVGKILRNL